MFRRVISSIAAAGVAVGGLMWGSAPALGAVSSVTLTPSSWALGSSPAATVTMSLSSGTTTSPYVIVDWDWGTSGWPAPGTTDEAASLSGGDTYTCASGISFQVVDATWSGSPNCDYLAAGPNPSVSRRVTLDGAIATPSGSGSPRIVVTIPEGMVTAQASATMVGVWTVNDGKQARASVTSSRNETVPIVTIDIDPNGGTCSISKMTGLQGTWAIAPGPSVCVKPGETFTGFTTGQDGSGIVVSPDGPVYFLTGNRIYAQYVEVRTPSAPLNVTATPGWQYVDVSWAAPADQGSSRIRNYLAQASTGQVCITRLTDADTLSCRFSQLTVGTRYTFTVQALNSSGWGESSAPSNETSPYEVRLGGVSRTKNNFFQGGGSTLNAQGIAPGLDAGTVVVPQLKVGASGEWVSQRNGQPKVKANGQYSWSTKLSRKINDQPVSLRFAYAGTASAEITVRRGQRIGLPSAPRNLKVESTINGIKVSWNSPVSNGGSPILTYTVKSGAKNFDCTVNAPETTCTKRFGARIAPGDSHTFTVVARSERGTGPAATKTAQLTNYRLQLVEGRRRPVRGDFDRDELTLKWNSRGFTRGSEFKVQVAESTDGRIGRWMTVPGAAQNTGVQPGSGLDMWSWTGRLPAKLTRSDVRVRVVSPAGTTEFGAQLPKRMSLRVRR